MLETLVILVIVAIVVSRKSRNDESGHVSKNGAISLQRVAVVLAALILGVTACKAVVVIRQQYDYLDHGAQRTVSVSLVVFAILFVYGFRRQWMEVSAVAGAFALVTLALGAAWEMDSGRYGGAFRACCSNLKNLGTALEMYANDSAGAFPNRLDQLVGGKYLLRVPTCPSAHADTYSAGYQAVNPAVPKERVSEARYTVVCSGSYHVSATSWPPNYPQYTSTQGLISPEGPDLGQR